MPQLEVHVTSELKGYLTSKLKLLLTPQLEEHVTSELKYTTKKNKFFSIKFTDGHMFSKALERTCVWQ